MSQPATAALPRDVTILLIEHDMDLVFRFADTISVLVSGARSSAVGLYVTTYYVGGALGGFLPAFIWQSRGWPGVVALVCTVFVAMLGLAMWQWPRKDRPAQVA